MVHVLKGFVFLQDAGLSPEIRQYAAVLLRKKLSKQWTKLNGNQREVIKNGILSSIVAEENGGNKAVHQALSQIAGLLFQKVVESHSPLFLVVRDKNRFILF